MTLYQLLYSGFDLDQAVYFFKQRLADKTDALLRSFQ